MAYITQWRASQAYVDFKVCGIFSVRGSNIKGSAPAGSILPSNNQKLGKSVFTPITVWLLLTRNTTVIVLIRDMSSNSVLTVVWRNPWWLQSESSMDVCSMYGSLLATFL